MFSRLLGVPILLAAAVGVPYLAANGPNIEGLLGKNASQTAPSAPSQQAPLESLMPVEPVRPKVPQGPGAILYPTATPLEGMKTLSLPEVINFNVTKEWVYQHWARKSTALSELGLFGIRVPLVTGTQLHDLAGSLTYFFSREGRVSRISFHGTSGDTTQLVMLVARQFGLQQQATPIAGEQLFQVRQEHQIFSELRTRPAPVLWASSPHDSFAVEFDLQRPGTATPLPSRGPPLPAIEAKAPPTASEQPSAEQAAKTVEAEGDPAEKWKAYFPRSRVPVKQVDGLNRRGRMW